MLGLFVFSSGAQTDTSAASQIKKLSIVMRGLELDHRRNVEGMLELWAFNQKKIPSVARLRFMHRAATEQIEAALRPFGYYRVQVDADLSDLGNQWQAVYRVTLGDRIKVANDPLISLNGVEVDCDDFRYKQHDRKSLLPEIAVEDDQFNKHKDLVLSFCEAQAKANLRKGAALNQQAYDALKQTLRTTASRLGYFDATFTKHEIRIDLRAYEATVTLEMSPGERYRIGETTLRQSKEWISPDLLDGYVDLQDQDYFDAGALQSLQSDLSTSDYYSQVDVTAAVESAEGLEIPVKVDLQDIKPREYVFGIGYGTDTRLRAKLGITGRRVNTRGHQYLAEGRVSEVGYGIAAEYTIPTGDPRTDSFGINFQLARDDEDKGESRSISLGGKYQYRDDLWFKSYSLDYLVDDFVVSDDSSSSTTTTLLMPSLEWTRTYPVEIEERLNPNDGAWLQLRLRGASDSLLSDTSFIQPGISVKLISSFASGHRLLTRASAATTWVEDFDKLPLEFRYYTGGDNSVRGYGFESIAPYNDSGKIQGGKHLLEASIEYEIPFKEVYSWAFFTDFGDAFDDNPELRQGLGVGFRWRSPIGPVRIDVARSRDEPGEGDVHLHVSLGADL